MSPGMRTFKMHLDLGKSFRPMTPIQITRRFIHVCINTFICIYIYIYMYTQYIRIYSIQDASSVEYLPTFTRNLSQNTSKCAIFMEHLGILSTSILHFYIIMINHVNVCIQTHESTWTSTIVDDALVLELDLIATIILGAVLTVGGFGQEGAITDPVTLTSHLRLLRCLWCDLRWGHQTMEYRVVVLVYSGGSC